VVLAGPDVEAYDPRSDTWQKCRGPGRLGIGVVRRVPGHGICVIGDKLGNGVQFYDPQRDEWSWAGKPSHSSALSERWIMGGAVTSSGEVLAFTESHVFSLKLSKLTAK
jgi:hypothetical protein